MNRYIYEGLEANDLARLINSTISVDEFVSKMGEDANIVVLAFKVGGKEPAVDLMNFIERGYDFVLDSDVSPGELDNGEYITFVELEREPELAENIFNLLEDVCRLTGEEMSTWKMRYKNTEGTSPVTLETLADIIPNTPEDYIKKYGEGDDNDEEEDLDQELQQMQEAAWVPIKKKSRQRDDELDALRSRAGLL
jgi:hypothetical protein